jgi:hypothetical protein
MVDIFTDKSSSSPNVSPRGNFPSPATTIATTPSKTQTLSPVAGTSTPGILSHFCPNPQGVSFSSQDSEESIYLLLRRHLVTNIPWLTTIVLLLILPLLIPPILHVSNPFDLFFPNGFPKNYAIVLVASYYLGIISVGFVNFLSWFFSVSLVTSEQVYDVDFSSLVYKEVSATRMHLVEDVTATQVGSIRSFFDYGDVVVQTAGTIDNFDFSAVPHPTKVANLIEDLIGKEEAEQEDKENDND